LRNRTWIEQSCHKDVESGDMWVNGFMENVIPFS